MKGSGSLAAIIILFVTSFALGLGVVWVNIERVDMSYELKKMQKELNELRSLQDKLEVEKNSLLAPQRLRKAAARLELIRPDREKVRRLGE